MYRSGLVPRPMAVLGLAGDHRVRAVSRMRRLRIIQAADRARQAMAHRAMPTRAHRVIRIDLLGYATHIARD